MIQHLGVKGTCRKEEGFPPNAVVMLVERAAPVVVHSDGNLLDRPEVDRWSAKEISPAYIPATAEYIVHLIIPVDEGAPVLVKGVDRIIGTEPIHISTS